MPIHTKHFDTITNSDPVNIERDLEELALRAATVKFKAGIEFRMEAFVKLLNLGYDAESAHAIASNLWEEA